MKAALYEGGADTMNVYIFALPGWAGFATFPGTGAPNDGVLLSNGYMGDTMVHEAGHWMGLYHTFQGDCDGEGDHVGDIPAMTKEAPRDCQQSDTCPAEGTDPIHTYMSFSYDDCRNEFTSGQVTRMHEQWEVYRASA